MPVTEKKKTASKPKTTAKKKKTSTSSSIRLSAAEKKLVQNYRKCNLIEKKLIETITEKAAGGIDLSSLIGLLK